MRFWKASAIIIAATIGEGIFALPYIFNQAGWLVSLVYLAVIAAVIITAHILYLETLRHVGEKERLLGLARRYLGEAGFWVGMVVILAGLLLALVAYLIIGPRFLILIFPSLPANVAFLILWLAISIPVLVNNGRAVLLEVLGVVFVAAMVCFVFLNGIAHFSFANLPFATTEQNALLPFGVFILALAGWTGIEPLYESTKGLGKGSSKESAENVALQRRGVMFGTMFAVLLYLLFVTGIFGSASQIVPDTISGLIGWALWKRVLISALGLFAIGTGSVPLTHELRNAMEKDLKWHYLASCLIIIFLPAAVVLSGLNNFIVVLGLAGGCFIALQYLLIIYVGRAALRLSPIKKIALDAVAAIFIAAVIYQITIFIVR